MDNRPGGRRAPRASSSEPADGVAASSPAERPLTSEAPSRSALFGPSERSGTNEPRSGKEGHSQGPSGAGSPASLAGSAGGGAAARSQGLGHAVRAFRHRDYALFWTGALVSNTGTWLANVTVPYVLYRLTRSELWVGMATFAQFIPGVVFGPTGGSLADRFDRRRVLMATQSLMGLAALALWLTWSGGLQSPVVILALVAVSGVLGGLNIPSWQAFVPDLVPRQDLLSAITLNSLQFNAARALGPAAAGIVLATAGPGAAFLVNAISFLCVLAALALLRQRAPAQRAGMTERGVVRQFGRALHYIRGQPGISISIGVAALIAFLGNPISQFTVVYSQDVYQVGNVAFGVLSAAMGIGAAVAAPLVSGWDAALPRSAIVRYGLPMYGLACTLFGISGNFTVGFVGLFLAGAGFLAIVSATNTAVQIIVADDVRGRVIAARVMSFTLAYSVGGLLQGFLAQWLGPRVTVTGAGLVLSALAIALALRPARLLRLDDGPDRD